MGHALKLTGISRLDVAAGIAFGLLGLAAVALALTVLDPMLRDPDGVIFSLSELYRAAFAR